MTMGNDTPRFSVVIPLHNKGPHVLRAIESVFSQTHPASEIIVIDDVSSDDGPEKVCALANDRIRLISRDTPGPGGYAARNAGIAAARGDWVAFLDADDKWEEDHLAQIAAQIGPDTGCVFTAHRIIPDEDVFPTDRQSFLLKDKDLTADDIVNAWLVAKRCPLWTGAIAARRDLLESVGPFREQGILRGGDKEMWLRIIAATTSRYSAAPTSCFYQDTVNRVSNSAPHTNLPAITSTIDRFIDEKKMNPDLLRRLRGQEIGLYIRYSIGRGNAVPFSFVRELPWQSPRNWLYIVFALGSFFFRLRPRRG